MNDPEEIKFVKEMIRLHPRLDELMAKTLYDCYKAGTLDKIIEERKALGEFVPDKPENLVLKNVTIE
mgnify:CR=1 FL=1|tara:strand:- start:969 stop:1169 length:201 start_codon:yes stop_codon:yes gene_type:complete